MPPSTPTLIGNLHGHVDSFGTFTAVGEQFAGGAIIATIGPLQGQARVRSADLPWTIDFLHTPPGKPPLTWIGAETKFAAREIDGRKVLVNSPTSPSTPVPALILGPSICPTTRSQPM